jgi:hypothetical protein
MAELMPRGLVTGDFSTLMSWERLLKHGRAMLPAMSAAMADRTIELIKDGFAKETDPYGNRWKDKRHPDGRKILHGKTGELRAGFRKKEASADRYQITNPVPYASAHQAPRGSSRAQRMMVPDEQKGMPSAWFDALQEISLDSLEEYFNGTVKKRRSRGMRVLSAIESVVHRVRGPRR